MTPLKVSIVAAIAAVILLLVIFELIRSRRLTGALRPAVAAHRSRDPRPGDLARRARATCEPGRHLIPTLGPVRARVVLRAAPASALLDGYLQAVGAEHDPGAAPGAARAPGRRRSGALGGQLAVDRFVRARGAVPRELGGPAYASRRPILRAREDVAGRPAQSLPARSDRSTGRRRRIPLAASLPSRRPRGSRTPSPRAAAGQSLRRGWGRRGPKQSRIARPARRRRHSRGPRLPAAPRSRGRSRSGRA